MKNLMTEISKTGIVPVVVLENADKAADVAGALRMGGVNCAEVTFRTDAAAESIKNMLRAYPDMMIGAGTVLTVAQVDQAVAAGAEFIVTPGYNPAVVSYCIEKNIPVIPGCMDTNAVEMALEKGLDTVKFFPAEPAGGLKMLKALAGPYVRLKFMPTGGINENNIAQYMAFDRVAACGGSWMVSPSLVREEKYGEITRLTKKAVMAMLDFKVREITEDENGEAALVLGCSSVFRAMYYLEKRGFHFKAETAVYQDGRAVSVYFEEKFGGYEVCLTGPEGDGR